MPSELKPCPFCGGEAKVVPYKLFSKALKAWKVESYGVVCKNCHTSGYTFWETEEHAVRAWNRRADNDDK